MFFSSFRIRHAFAKLLTVTFTLLVIATSATGWAQITIQARAAGQFVDSMGVNVHLESQHLPYGNYFVINQRLESLGMRHIRDEINRADPSFKDESFVDEIQSAGGLGYKLCGLIEGGNDYPRHGSRLKSDHVVPMIERLLPTIDAVEGPNEPDDGGFVYDGVPYPHGAINESKDLWEIVKGDSDISDLPVLAMSEGSPQDFERLADITHHEVVNYARYGNMHAYQSGLEGDWGLTQTYIPDAQSWTGSKPLWTTEMGYHNYTRYLSNGEQQGVSQRASAIYLPIAFLEGFHQGVLRTFSYELIDEVDDPQLSRDCTKSKFGLSYCSGEGHYGLLNYDGRPKPAFTALQNLIMLLREPEVKDFAAAGALTISLSGAPPTMRYTLLQKSNGAYYLALWNDVRVYELAKQTKSGVVLGKDLYPPAVPVTLTFSSQKDFTVYAPSDTSGVNPTDRYTISRTLSSISLDLPPKVLLIKIVDATGPGS